MAYLRRNGYMYERRNGKEFLQHRLIWEDYYGEKPNGQIDHIDGNKLNNNIENLRDVTSLENQRNRTRQYNNTTGCTGIYWDKKRNKWIAKIQIKRTAIYLGGFEDIEDAICCRKKAEKEYDFHKNHDKEYLGVK